MLHGDMTERGHKTHMKQLKEKPDNHKDKTQKESRGKDTGSERQGAQMRITKFY